MATPSLPSRRIVRTTRTVTASRPLDALHLTLAALAAGAMACATLGAVYAVQVDKVAKASPHGLACFTADGRPTIGDDWKECRQVAFMAVR